MLTQQKKLTLETIDTTKQADTSIGSADIFENTIREQFPHILDILLVDRTQSNQRTRKNIIWANEHYVQYGAKAYAATAQIRPELVTGTMGELIMPRALKSKALQKERTKAKAEVFTPTWIVKKQNDQVDLAYVNDALEKYVKRRWLEITCGEAPYMATRYDMETGTLIPLEERVGFVDRKLKRINEEVDDKAEWQQPKNANNLSKLNNTEIKEDSQIVLIDNRQNVFENVAGAEWTNIIIWQRGYDNGLHGLQKIFTNGEEPQIIKLITDKGQIAKPHELTELFDCVKKLIQIGRHYKKSHLLESLMD